MRLLLAVAVLSLAGCLSDVPGPTQETEATSRAVSYTNLVQVVGVGVPGQFCDDQDVNSEKLTWIIEAPDGAMEAQVTNVRVEIEGDDTVNDVDLFLYRPDGTLVASATSSANTEAITVAGPEPAGEYVIEVRGCSGAGTVSVAGGATVSWTHDATP